MKLVVAPQLRSKSTAVHASSGEGTDSTIVFTQAERSASWTRFMASMATVTTASVTTIKLTAAGRLLPGSWVSF